MKSIKLMLFFLVGIIFWVNLSYGEEVTLTTFYPSPAGVYKELKVENIKANSLQLQPQAQLPSEPSEGMIFFSSGKARDNDGKIFTRGLWIYAEDKWFPMAIFRPTD
ncbi:MAG: hypothetical protein K9L61_04070 [Candidatus Omnitrophica bacterium]|nr:hypothetical protein [Candidatus Omnitrophota bacterium]